MSELRAVFFASSTAGENNDPAPPNSCCPYGGGTL
jgi:hypothetical protein